jgi:hypothetical protein
MQRTPPVVLSWFKILSQCDIADAGGLAILQEACRAIDRSEQFAEQIARDGLTLRRRR